MLQHLVCSLLLYVSLVGSCNITQGQSIRARLIGVERIWDHTSHNAFTDLTRWRGKWYCAFREGEHHAGDVGKLRVLVSKDGSVWESAALLEMPDYDLRDAALSVTPDDRLMIMGGAQKNIEGKCQTGTFVSYMSNDEPATEPRIVIPLGRWLWRVTWHLGKAYGVSYGNRSEAAYSALHVSEDGDHYDVLQERFLGEGWPTEARIRFAEDGMAYCLHRRDGRDPSAYLGRSKPPYKSWTWSDLGVRLGGPNFIQTPAGDWIAAGRLYDNPVRTSLCSLDLKQAKLTPILALPSGGDTSYPGMVWYDNHLWMSYYSSHEGKACIYLAKIAIEHDGSQNEIRRELGTRREPFVDDWLIDELNGASLALQRPIDAGIVLRFDKPWEGRFSGYSTVIYDQGRYRLYYRGLPVAGGDGSDNESTCYAESKDGINWEKPILDLFPAKSGDGTNRVLADASPASHNFSPFLDENPSADTDARFKAVGGTAASGLFGFISADGIRWRKLRGEPIFRVDGWVFDSQNVCFWSQRGKRYELYFRVVPNGIRSVARSTSNDFVTWTEPTLMTYSDTETTRPSEQLYTNQTHPYFRAPHILVSTAARFFPGRKAITDEQAKQIGVHPQYFNDTSDAVLMTSRDQARYDRTYMSALIRPGIGAENWVSRSNYPALNIVPTSKTEMSLYVNQNYGQPTAHLRRYVFRTDGLSAVTAAPTGGEMVTKEFTFSGDALSLNYATSAAGEMTVECLTPERQPIDGFKASDCDIIIGNEISRVVKWNGKSEVSELSGRPIRLRFVLKDAELFSIKFDTE